MRIYNADHNADYANGFAPDVPVEELVLGNELLPLGDTDELLLSEAISRITGLKSQSVRSESGERIKLPLSFERKKTEGLIFDTEK